MTSRDNLEDLIRGMSREEAEFVLRLALARWAPLAGARTPTTLTRLAGILGQALGGPITLMTAEGLFRMAASSDAPPPWTDGAGGGPLVQDLPLRDPPTSARPPLDVQSLAARVDEIARRLAWLERELHMAGVRISGLGR